MHEAFGAGPVGGAGGVGGVLGGLGGGGGGWWWWSSSHSISSSISLTSRSVHAKTVCKYECFATANKYSYNNQNSYS